MDSRLGNSPHELPSVPGHGSNTFATTKPRKSQRELIDFVRELDSYIVTDCPGLSSRTLSLRGLDMEKSLLTSDGSESYLMVPRSICYIMMSIEKDGVYAEAGLKDCILDADLAGVFAHEAIGHTAFGETCPVPVYVDDEGTSATDAVLIEDGVLKGFMHSKESAVHFGAKPTGNAKAYRFSDEPLIRMRNTTVLPGESTLEEMIASIDSGYYLLNFNNGQADTTSEFKFGITLGYEINKGKIGKAIRDTTISGVAFETLKTVSMISNDLSWSCSGMCGKKQARSGPW